MFEDDLLQKVVRLLEVINEKLDILVEDKVRSSAAFLTCKDVTCLKPKSPNSDFCKLHTPIHYKQVNVVNGALT